MIRRRGMARGQDGFTLVELIVSALIAMAVSAALVGLVGQARRVFAAQPEESDVQQRVRVGVDRLQQDLVMAGAGTYLGTVSGPLGFFLPPVMPYRAFGGAPDPGAHTLFRPDSVSVLYVPSTPSQSWLAAPLLPGAIDAQLASPPNCPAPTATRLCGLEAGDRLLVFDAASQWDIFSVAQAGAGLLSLEHLGPPAAGYETGAAVAAVRLATYYLKADDRARTYQLMRHDGWTTETPVVDEVVRLEFRYFGEADPPRLTGTPLDNTARPWTTYGPAPPPIGASRGGWWPAGENCLFMAVDDRHVPRLGPLGAGGPAQVELTAAQLTDGPWCPDPVAANRFDADLLRVRRVHVRLRVQSASAALRGPAGTLFLKGGTARAGDRYAPDIEVQFDVTPRNLNLGR
jgi:hypothetical protein